MLLWHLLRKNIAVGQLVGYILATLLGLTIVLMSIQFFTDIRPVFSEKKGVFARDYLVISKKVSIFKTLKISKTSFSEDEMKEIVDQPFVKRLAGFTTATFRVYASMAMGGKMANLGTALFFESVPNQFLDIKPDDWKWNEGSNFIPIILPRSYLTLYNFGFAPSQGLPQLSGSMLSKLDLTIELTGNAKDALFHSRIVGFTDRINSILVPQSFMEWANAQFGTASTPPSRLILEPYNLTDPHMGDFFASHNYEVANDKAAAGEASSFLRTLIFVVLGVGVIITLLALGLMLLSINLLIQKNHEKIENLALAGYPASVIARPYQGLVIVINSVIFVLSFLMVSYLRDYYITMFSSSLHIDDTTWAWNNLIWGGGIILGLTIVNSVWIYLKIREIRR
jgi:uncharacterized membrane protein YciS (DUF1049 family)